MRSYVHTAPGVADDRGIDQPQQGHGAVCQDDWPRDAPYPAERGRLG